MSTKIEEKSREKKKKKLFILSSKMGAGKDFMRSIIFNLLRQHGYSPLAISFADHFKIECVSKDGIDFEKVFGEKRDSETRKMLQHRGTEQGIQVYGKEIWCNTTHAWIKVQCERGIDSFIGADARFQHEIHWANYLRCGINVGGEEYKFAPLTELFDVYIIRLVAPKRSWARALKEADGNEEVARVISNHVSETALDDTLFNKYYNLIVDNDPKDAEQSVELVTNFVRGVLRPPL
jgi:hypothetical protein